MAKIDPRRHAISRLESLLQKAATHMKGGLNRQEYLAWKNSLLFFIEKLCGPYSKQGKELSNILNGGPGGEPRSPLDPKLSMDEMSERLKLAASVLYRILHRRPPPERPANEPGTPGPFTKKNTR